MSASIIDGAMIAADVRKSVAAAASALKAKHGAAPELAVLLVGEDPASQVYVRSKVKQTEEAGMRSHHLTLPADATQAQVIEKVRALSADKNVDGILVQLPLPKHIDEQAVLAALDPDKDVDGLTEVSAGRLVLGKPGLRPCTPAGSVILAKRTTPDLAGAHCVVVGRSILVGKPAALLFLAENCTVTLAHSKTKDLPGLCRSADILVAAIGRPEMIKGDWVKPGGMVIDVGINRVPASTPGKTKLVGDVAYAEAKEVAGAITPVPGGVGPMTIACLLRNTVLAACARRGWEVPAALG
ncbi:MAG: bifunctional methylenetetrahydrofolate dehydrogenase/methenyltetrahydrofolate cyclohydrolase FolD [Hyphomonadaceae bacterium]|nr:bifunctional methylenetetrahydrofolate dehydrogenase/methenyltetrahydrofolate cyclohydrolase FolD [Hyphomonadaceae bacterium]